MMKIFYKTSISSFLIVVFGALFFPNVSFAQSSSMQTSPDLTQLKQLISSLQAQITTLESKNSFFRDLKEGDEGEDVYRLQVFLNKNDFTRIALAGPGSPGNETRFFGSLTASAVKRFQELNRDKILIPLGLTKGTGFFGPSTRKVLNDLLDSTSASAISGQIVIEPEKKLKIISINPEKGVNKTEITITGEGFEKTNNILTTFQVFPDIVSNDGKTLKVKLDFNFLAGLPSESEISSLTDSLLQDDLNFNGQTTIIDGNAGYSDLGYFEVGQTGFNEVPVYIMVQNSRGESQPTKFILTL